MGHTYGLSQLYTVGVPFPISLGFWVELVGACNSIYTMHIIFNDQFL
jgi:hypothetical protein